MAEKPCSQCMYYDPVIRGTREVRHGRCAIKSVYPAEEQAGQTFPPGVKRAALGDLAAPVIVVGTETVKSCTQFRAKAPAPASAKKVRK